jgi:short-subunit dehydrogenase
MSEGDNIICTTSINAYKGNASLIDYTSTKGAIVAFVRAMSMNLAERKIRVNGKFTLCFGPLLQLVLPSQSMEEKIIRMDRLIKLYKYFHVCSRIFEKHMGILTELIVRGYRSF